MMKFVVLCALIATTLAAPSTQENQVSLFGEVYNLYSSCSDKDLSVCLKIKALGIVDRAARSAEINLMDGIKIVKTEEAKASRADNARSLNDIEASLPAETEAREAAVDDAIFDRASRFLSTHNVEFSYPSSAESRALGDEPRLHKKKKGLKALLPILMLLKLKALVLVPILIGGLALLAFKALVIGKIALIISAILAFQKLLGNKTGQGFESHPIVHDEHQHHSSGWARAYAAQKPAQ